MADIELVIKISDSLYDRLLDMNIDSDTCSFNESALVESIQNGIPLPKGHGELKDVNEIWYLYDYNDIDYTMIDALNDAPIIIEEDTENEESNADSN